MDLSELIDEYFKIQKEIHEAFGYEENWRVIPLEDTRECYWHFTGNSLIFCEKPLTSEVLTNGKYYEDELYTQRHLSKWVYRTERFTLISVDTHTDFNMFLRILDNDKEVKELPEYRPF